MPGPYAQAWEDYQDLGWQGTLPLPERRKHHPPRGYTGAAGTWPTYADCWDWSDDPAHEGANIALRLPDGIIGVDVDAYDNKPGAATLTAAEQQWGALPPTWRTTSRDDGTSGIRLYRTPTGLAWPGEAGPGIDVIQERHRYAVAPPSTHPEGRTYRWITPHGATSTVPPDPHTLPALPAEWVLGLTRGRQATHDERADLDDEQTAAWLTGQERAAQAPCQRMAHQLDTALHTLTQGSAHNNANTAAIRLIRLSDEGHAGLDEALARLRAAFTAEITRPGRPGERTPGQAAAEWDRNITGAVRLVAAKPSTTHTCDCGTNLADLIAPPPPNAAQDTPGGEAAEYPVSDADEARRLARARLVAEEVAKLEIRAEAQRILRERQRPAETPSIVALDEFLAVQDPPQRYRIEGLWPLGGRVMLAAQFKAGKTTLVGNALRSLVDGDPFLDTFQVEPLAPGRRVVVIDDELDQRMIRSWLRDQDITHTDAAAVLPLRGNLTSFDILDPHVRSRWAGALKEIGAEVVILDCLAPLVDALGLSEDKEAGQLLVAFDELLGEAGVSEALVVHHMGHTGERTRGASRLRDWPDVEWRLVREKGEDGETDPSAPRFLSAYGRDVDVPESALQFDPLTRRLSISGGSRKEAKATEAVEAVVEYLTVNPESSGRKIEDALIDDIPQKVIREALKQMRTTGRVVVQDGPKRARLHSLNPSWTPPSGSVRYVRQEAGQRTESECVSVSLRDTLHSHSPTPHTTPSGSDAHTHPHGLDLIVIDGRIIERTRGHILERHGDDLINTSNGEIHHGAARHPAVRHA